MNYNLPNCTDILRMKIMADQQKTLTEIYLVYPIVVVVQGKLQMQTEVIIILNSQHEIITMLFNSCYYIIQDPKRRKVDNASKVRKIINYLKSYKCWMN